MKSVDTPQSRCRAAIARCDITPPVGIYHRMWGAAQHDRATGVHKPLLATILWLKPEAGDTARSFILANLDHCLFDDADIALMKSSIASAAGVSANQVLIAVTHTHAAGLMSRSRAALPGGELIAPYLDNLVHQLAQLAKTAAADSQPATIVYAAGRCNLAANRDFFDVERQQFVCGFNPSGPADDALLVAKITTDSGQTIATLVNYACHPTTLAWQNMLISPDYIGALRETIEQHIAAPCMFLQGASADLGPREGFVGDPLIADRNGRQLAFSALSAINALSPPNTRYVYAGPVVSGATIGTWQHQPLSDTDRNRQAAWNVRHWNTDLQYRIDLPTVAAAEADLATWQARQQQAIADGHSQQACDYHARIEQAQRQLWRLQSLPQPHFPLPVTVARLGDAIWLFIAGEHYQNLQTELRTRFPDRPIIVSTITNGWQPGYIPPAQVYGRGIYQEQIAVVAPGTAEQLLSNITDQVQSLLT